MLTVNNNSKFHFEPDYRDETGMEQECGGNCNYAVQCEAPDGRTGIKQSWTHRNTDEVQRNFIHGTPTIIIIV